MNEEIYLRRKEMSWVGKEGAENSAMRIRVFVEGAPRLRRLLLLLEGRSEKAGTIM